jgi:S1-C subfamily serine protease
MLFQGGAKAIMAVGRISPTGIQLLGTAFSLGGPYLATTAHVTGPVDQNLCAIISKIGQLSDYQDTTDAQVNSVPVKLAAYDPVRDIAILQFDGTNTTGTQLGSSDLLAVGDVVASIGFPHADHNRLVMTEQRSTVGARVILGAQGIKTKHIILNVQTRPGQSGSPVLTIDGKFVAAMIIGSYAPSGGGGVIVGGVDPNTLHQTTHAISAEYIRELLP